MQIGNINLGHFPLVLAPMEGVTDKPFRLICKACGADWLYSEFVNASGLVRGAGLSKLYFSQYERPFSVQIYGEKLDEVVESAAIVQDIANPDSIDINAGCPAKKVVRRGAGAGLLLEPALLVRIARAVVKKVRVPVTVKLRLGWDSEHIIIDSLAQQLQQVGVSALTIHGRTKAQLFTGSADWDAIARVAHHPAMHIPIIGNGDINTPQRAYDALHKYGVQGVMIGRAAIGEPWLFASIKHMLATGQPLPSPTLAQRVDIARKHLALSLQYKGEKKGVFEMRRHLNLYFKGFPHFKTYRLALLQEEDPQQLDYLLQELCCNYACAQPLEQGELRE